MKNRQNLREYGIAMIIIGVLNLFNFVTAIIDGFLDGSIEAEISKADPDILGAVKVTLIIIAVIMGLLAISDALLGIKGIKVSANPTAAKGYITVTKIFFVLTAISVVFAVVDLFSGVDGIADRIGTLANTVLSACIYILFIKAAEAVRNDVTTGAK